MKIWEPDMDFEKDYIQSLPIWVKLKLRIKYRGKILCIKLLSKLVSLFKRMKPLERGIWFSLLDID